MTRGIFYVGDVMYDAWLLFAPLAASTTILDQLGLKPQGYYVATIHRPANTDKLQNLAGILEAFAQLSAPVVFPVHPRTRKHVHQYGLEPSANVLLIEPVGYLEMLALTKNSCAVLTDSGGVQREAYFSNVPCVTIRSEAEFVDTVTSGWNTLAEPTGAAITAALAKPRPVGTPPPLFGNGRAAQRIAAELKGWAASRQA
jgi:UDP-N-acetylglucosamine 2-epimerase